jgi:hypothetical protein
VVVQTRGLEHLLEMVGGHFGQRSLSLLAHRDYLHLVVPLLILLYLVGPCSGAPIGFFDALGFQPAVVKNFPIVS